VEYMDRRWDWPPERRADGRGDGVVLAWRCDCGVERPVKLVDSGVASNVDRGVLYTDMDGASTGFG
jgi:hypothetical protein